MSAADALVVLVTAGSKDEATRIARALVEEGLAACVNLVPGVRSIYRWEGAVADEEEVLLIAKTRRQRFDELESRIRALHSYAVPEILALAVEGGSAAYLDWLAASVASSKSA